MTDKPKRLDKATLNKALDSLESLLMAYVRTLNRTTPVESLVEFVRDHIAAIEAEIKELKSDMPTVCLYCGEQYSIDKLNIAAAVQLCKKHIHKCEEHPLFQALADNRRLRGWMERIKAELKPLSKETCYGKYSGCGTADNMACRCDTLLDIAREALGETDEI